MVRTYGLCAVKGVSARSVEQQIPATNSSLAAALLDSQPRANPDAHRAKGESVLSALHYFVFLCVFQARYTIFMKFRLLSFVVFEQH